MAALIAALIWANSPWAAGYEEIWKHLGIQHLLSEPITKGVAIGLLLGKPLGIGLASWLAVKASLASLPHKVNFRHIHGAAWLGGIGFTMSLFIAALAFPGQDLLTAAKIGILAGSLLAGLVGFMFLRRA